MIEVHLPAMLRQPDMPQILRVEEPVETIGDLVRALDAGYPGLATGIDDSILNFAVNGTLVLHDARQKTLHAGDVVEIIPMISGG